LCQAHFSDKGDNLGQADLSFLDDSVETDLENGDDDDDEGEFTDTVMYNKSPG